MNKANSLITRVCLSTSVGVAIVIFATSIAVAASGDREGRILTSGPPMYPAYCFNKRLQGHVDFMFDVDTEGLVRDPTVLDAVVYKKSVEHPVDDEKARRAFISAATKALGNFRYEPPIKDGQILEVKGVKTRISFAL